MKVFLSTHNEFVNNIINCLDCLEGSLQSVNQVLAEVFLNMFVEIFLVCVSEKQM